MKAKKKNLKVMKKEKIGKELVNLKKKINNNESARKWRKTKLILKRSVNEQWKEIKKANEESERRKRTKQRRRKARAENC